MLRRNLDPITTKLLSVQYDALVNVDNIERLTRFKINKIFKDEEFKIRNIFLHNLLSEWIKEYKNHDEDFFRILNRLVRKTKIDISDEEKHDLFLLEERAFSRERHIKIIEVQYKLTPKERVGVKFVGARLFKHDGERLDKITKDDLLISNRRIIFPNIDMSFRFSTITAYWFRDYGFEFRYDGKIYVVRIHDQETLNKTMENIIGKKVKNAIKKRKDN